MVTQPIGDTGIILKPFLSLDFQGQVDFDQPPAGGLQTEYKPNRDLKLSWTNWIGPGFVLFGGQPLRHPYPQGGYGDSEYGDANAIENWQGPNLYAERGGTLYFTDANILWRPRNDLSLGAEFLLGTTDASSGRWGWSGVMFAGNFSVTDHISVFARASFINDADWLIYGMFQNITEGNVGISYRFNDHLEIRGEYRHDHGSESGDTDSFSIHLAVGI